MKSAMRPRLARKIVGGVAGVAIVALALRLSAGRPAEHVTLATRVQVDE